MNWMGRGVVITPILKQERENTEHLLCAAGQDCSLYNLCPFLSLLPREGTAIGLPHRLEHAQIIVTRLQFFSNMIPLEIQRAQWLRALVALAEDPGLISRTYVVHNHL